MKTKQKNVVRHVRGKGKKLKVGIQVEQLLNIDGFYRFRAVLQSNGVIISAYGSGLGFYEAQDASVNRVLELYRRLLGV